jgi:hypothetical protein
LPAASEIYLCLAESIPQAIFVVDEQISPLVLPSETILFVSKLMAKNTSLLTKNTGFEHKFHFDTRKCAKRQNGGHFTIILPYFIWP